MNIRLLGAHQPLSAGRRYDLLCQSAGSRPPAVITWWRDGQRLEKTTETVSLFYAHFDPIFFSEGRKREKTVSRTENVNENGNEKYNFPFVTSAKIEILFRFCFFDR